MPKEKTLETEVKKESTWKQSPTLVTSDAFPRSSTISWIIQLVILDEENVLSKDLEMANSQLRRESIFPLSQRFS